MILTALIVAATIVQDLTHSTLMSGLLLILAVVVKVSVTGTLLPLDRIKQTRPHALPYALDKKILCG
jgi:hypothetical protein